MYWEQTSHNPRPGHTPWEFCSCGESVHRIKAKKIRVQDIGQEVNYFKVEMSHTHSNIINEKDKIGERSSPVLEGNNHTE